MEERLIEQVQQMAGVDLEDIDDEEYERLQAILLESMTAQEELNVNQAAVNNEANADEDLPEGMAAQMIRPAAPMQNLANQFADWANMRVAATEEEKKGDQPDANEEEKK